MTGQTDEVLDDNFNAIWLNKVTASSNSPVRIYSSMTGTCLGILDDKLL